MKAKLLVSACLLGIPCRYDAKSKIGEFGAEKRSLEEILPALSERYELVPFCPEIYGGLPTPRTPSERVGDRVLTRDGFDVSAEYQKGAESALRLCHTLEIRHALLKAKSPACGVGKIYDGTHTATLTDGNGVCAQALLDDGLLVVNEDAIEQLLK